jgi:hypothetical protein
MTAIVPVVGSLQAIGATKSGLQIGGTTFTTGDGSPAGVMTALRIGDVYIDYTNGVFYMASATGTGSWVALAALASSAAGFDVGTDLTVGGTAEFTGVATFTAAPILPTATVIGGVTIYTVSNTANLPTPHRIGDIAIIYASTGAGKMYIAGGVSASSDWKLVTSA